jgi:hypothetical protein
MALGAADDEDARAARNAALIVNLLFLVGTLSGAVKFSSLPGSALMVSRSIQCIFNAGWIVVLLTETRRPRLALSLIAFALAPLPMLADLTIIARAHEASQLGWEPLIRQKIVFIVYAALAPRQAWVSMLVIGVFAVEACIEYWPGGLGASAQMTPHEPWVTLAFAAAATWIASARGRQLARQRTLEHRLRSAAAAARMAKMALAVRDLANTPLQVIELQLAILDKHLESAPGETASLHRALARLKELNEMLVTHADHDADAPPESFDAAAILQREHEGIARSPRTP